MQYCQVRVPGRTPFEAPRKGGNQVSAQQAKHGQSDAVDFARSATERPPRELAG